LLKTNIIRFFKAISAKTKVALLNTLIDKAVCFELSLKIKKEIKLYNTFPLKEENLQTDINYIWFCWFQGIQQAPVLVRKCYEHLMLNKPDDYKVVVITDENYKDYVKMPLHIIEKYEKGIITKTHFSDILRFALLAENGGLWIDSTVLTLTNLAVLLKENSFLTLKNDNYDKYTSISNGKWTGYFIKMQKSSGAALLIRDCFYKYWEVENELFDYYFVDYALLLAYQNLHDFRNKVDRLKNFGDNRFLLKNILNKKINPVDSNSIDLDPIKIYKLNNKMELTEYTENGEETYFKKYIIN
jgi:hypothetical protein